eukprot:1750686-Pyramimonas_sp.AAC.1
MWPPGSSSVRTARGRETGRAASSGRPARRYHPRDGPGWPDRGGGPPRSTGLTGPDWATGLTGPGAAGPGSLGLARPAAPAHPGGARSLHLASAPAARAPTRRVHAGTMVRRPLYTWGILRMKDCATAPQSSLDMTPKICAIDSDWSR